MLIFLMYLKEQTAESCLVSEFLNEINPSRLITSVDIMKELYLHLIGEKNVFDPSISLAAILVWAIINLGLICFCSQLIGFLCL